MDFPFHHRKGPAMTATPSDTLFRWQLADFGRQHLRRVEAPIPQPGPGQILVRVEDGEVTLRPEWARGL